MADLSLAELDELGVKQWSTIAGDFKDADLLLGNGFSMSLHPTFSYQSLFARFLAKAVPADQGTLPAFNTSNFEFILEDLSTTARVNSILQISTQQAVALAGRVREGLIRAIEESHPRKHEVSWLRLQNIASQLSPFRDIYTLNYDALLYHIIMICKDRWERGDRSGRYNDYYWNRISPDYLKFMDFQSYRPYKHVYYLHGALFLFKSVTFEPLVEVDVKLCLNASGELLDAIAAEIRSGTLPLFVSEGKSEEKQRAIARSDYLRFANDALEAARECIVVYGASLGDQDRHIANSVRRRTSRAAVSVYPVGKSAIQIDQELNTMRTRLPGMKLSFYDARTLFI
jgi:hypothetical protein